MSSRLVVNQIQDSAAKNIDTTFVTNGSAKAWVQFDGDIVDPTANKSLNHSSITYEAEGDYSLIVTNAFDGVDYGAVLSGGRDGAANAGGDMSLATATTAPTSTTTRIRSYRNINSSAESLNGVSNITEVRYGDLA